jgi:peptidoglycan hydrolase-like protein with peptidoglycan-binding domain
MVTPDLFYKSSSGQYYYPTNLYSVAMQDLLKSPKGTSITELNTSSASEGIKSVMAALNYGTQRGKTTVNPVILRRFTTNPYPEPMFGNTMHLAEARFTPNYELQITGDKPRTFQFKSTDLQDYINGKASPEVIKRLQQAFDYYKTRTIDHMGYGIKKLNEINPNLKFSEPIVVDNSAIPVNLTSFVRALVNSGRIKSYVKRDPFFIDLHKKGGKMHKFQPGGIFQRFNYNNIYQNSREDIKELQRALGVKDDGIIGRQTISALQNKIGTKTDGV